MTSAALQSAIPSLDQLKPSTSHASDPSTDIPALDGKVILITGGNSGIGKQTAIALARHDPAQIWIAARQANSGLEAVRDIKVTRPGVDVKFLRLDLTTFESIKAAAKIMLAEAAKLDLLMLNAGIVSTYRRFTLMLERY